MTVSRYYSEHEQRHLWQFRFTYTSADGKRRNVKRKGYTTQRDAQREERALRARIDAGHTLGTAQGTVDAYLTAWLESYEASGSVKTSTGNATRLHVDKYLRPRIGHLQLRQLTAARIDALYVDLHRHGRTGGAGRGPQGSALSPKTVRNIAGTLHKALSDAVRLGVLGWNPADNVRLPKWDKPDLQVLTVEEVAQFLTHAEQVDDPCLALWRLLLLGGLRRGEVLGLRWDCVDWVNAQVSIVETLVTTNGQHVAETPKSAAGRRTVALDTDTLSALGRLRNAQDDAARVLRGWHSPYVATDLDGRRILGQTLTKRFQRASRAAGVRVVRLHDTRHTHVSHLIDSGTQILAVSARVGHARPSFTLDVYGHLLPNRDRDAADTVGASIAAAMRHPGTHSGHAGHIRDTVSDDSGRTEQHSPNTKPIQDNDSRTGRDHTLERTTGFEPDPDTR